MSDHPAPPPRRPERDDQQAVPRCRAAIDTLELFAANVRTIRRSEHPPAAQTRLTQILRLTSETIELLQRRLAALESGPAASPAGPPPSAAEEAAKP